MSTKSFYPEIHRGDEVEFAPTEDTPEQHWIMGTVVRTKNESVDIRVFERDTGRIYLDVRHVGDPMLDKLPRRSDTGVFKLANRQLKINQIIADHEAMKRRMDALEQTFRAVTGGSESADVPNPAGRRQTRQMAGATT